MAVPRKAFYTMKNIRFINDTINMIVDIYKIRLENLVQVRGSCFNDTLVRSYYIMSMYYIKITIQRVRKYATIKHSIQLMYFWTYIFYAHKLLYTDTFSVITVR